jgi:glucose-1-phosphate thymidylyltransferase
MIQVAGRPMIGHILDELTHYDIEEVTLVVGHLGDAIRNYVTKAYPFKFQFVTQEELRGLGHAIWMTGDLYRGTDDPLLIILGDTIFDADFKSIIGSDDNWIGVKEVDDPRRFGVVELKNGVICAMVEKPEKPPTNLAVVGIYYFTDSRMLYECLDALIASGKTTKGEFQLTDALQCMIERKAILKPFVIDGWHDCGKPETLLETNRTLLAKRAARDGASSPPVFEGSLIKPPVSIGKGVKIENSIVGPYVTVADGVTIRNAIVRDSIVSQGAVVENMLLEGSIIADHAKAVGRTTHLNVGDSSELNLG